MAFNISNFLNEESRKEVKSDWKPIRISVHKLRPAAGKENFYHMDDREVEETARTIELIGMQQYPVVKPVEGDEYEVISGHKRRLAVLKLLDEGKPEYEMIPCKVEGGTDSIRNELILIFTNSTQRNRTDYEKMQEIKRVKELLTEYQKSNELTGRRQNIIAEILGTSKTKVGTLDNIDRNLIEPFKAEFKANKISTSTANEIAGLEADAQQALYETYKETGSVTAKDAKELKEENTKGEEPQIEGQMELSDCLPDSERQQEPQKEAEPKGNTPEPEKGQETAQDEPQEPFMNESETTVTYNQLQPNRTDKKSLIINGRINPNKEYNGMAVNYFMGAIINSDLFDTEFWEDWKNCVITNTPKSKALYVAEYAGTKTTYTIQTAETEKCEALLTDQGLEVYRVAARQQATISYENLAELIDVMIYTKVIEIKAIDSDLKFWAYRTAKELATVSNYLTESEVFILQDLMMRCKERAGR